MAHEGIAYAAAPNLRVTAANGVDYVYRRLGASARPLVLLQHLRGNLDTGTGRWSIGSPCRMTSWPSITPV
jgi:hypothetical protein